MSIEKMSLACLFDIGLCENKKLIDGCLYGQCVFIKENKTDCCAKLKAYLK